MLEEQMFLSVSLPATELCLLSVEHLNLPKVGADFSGMSDVCQ